jgi:hypothetical protein
MKIIFEGEYRSVVREMVEFLSPRAVEENSAEIGKPTPKKKAKAKAAPKEEAASPKTGSRRKGNGAAPKEEAPAAEEEGGITDSDLAKAASEAARLVTSGAVTEVIDQFGVGHLRELDQEQRREFLEALKAKVEG